MFRTTRNFNHPGEQFLQVLYRNMWHMKRLYCWTVFLLKRVAISTHILRLVNHVTDGDGKEYKQKVVRR